MKEQIRGFNEVYEKVKRMGFENYFCLPETTWKDAFEKFKRGELLKDEVSIHELRYNVNMGLVYLLPKHIKRIVDFSHNKHKIKKLK